MGEAVELRCHCCSHGVGTAVSTMRLVGLFRAAAVGVIPPAHAQELRRRCRTCGWVNIFHPLTRRGPRFMVETKLRK